MANVDRPDGFRFIKSLSGNPMNSLVRDVQPGSDDLYIGDPISITSGVAVQAAVEGIVAGVIVGWGSTDDDGNVVPLNQVHAEKKWFDDSAETNADWRVLYVPAENTIWEAQFDDSEDIVIGEGYDFLVAGAGTSASGQSKFEIDGDAKTNDGDVVVVETPRGPKYDQATGVANKRVWVSFVNTLAGQI